MTLKFFETLLGQTDESEATGTYADGVFHLTLSEQLAADRRYGLRTSYDRDHRTAIKLENLPAAAFV